jgi:hypothetical protein
MKIKVIGQNRALAKKERPRMMKAILIRLGGQSSRKRKINSKEPMSKMNIMGKNKAYLLMIFQISNRTLKRGWKELEIEHFKLMA